VIVELAAVTPAALEAMNRLRARVRVALPDGNEGDDPPITFGGGPGAGPRSALPLLGQMRFTRCRERA
jgi:hypothetical protein